MATTWPASRVPFIDEDGNPMVGAKLYFYDSNTTTPQPVYSDAALSVPIDQPILADARGMFQTIFLNPTPGSYRQKLTDADDVLIFDDDQIDVPQSATYVPPDAGTTDITLLARTGDLKPFYGTASIPSGWVRSAGRTIGSASSGATERANADCQALFLHLWTEDSTALLLTVSGGRGGSAASDWAANKTITLPDFRERGMVGLATMGAAAAGRIANGLVDGGKTSSILGATAGVDDVALAVSELPSHNHGGSTTGTGAHGHQTRVSTQNAGGADTTGGIMLNAAGVANYAAYTGTTDDDPGHQVGDGPHTHTIASQGGGAAHQNLQPSMFVSVLIKL